MEKVDQYVWLTDVEDAIYYDNGMQALMDELNATLVHMSVRGNVRYFKVVDCIGSVYGYKTPR